MTLNRVPIPSPNYSERGAAVRLVVLHTAEGALTYQSLGAFFQNPASQVSSHVGIDDTPNTVGEYVRPNYKAWTQANANPVAIAAEMCAFAAWSTDEWMTHPEMLKNCANWIAEECNRFNIPIVRLTPAQAQGGGEGICGHVDLGAWGGNHWDPGLGFPMDYVIQMAKSGTPTPKPPPITIPKGETIAVEQITVNGKQYLVSNIVADGHLIQVRQELASIGQASNGQNTSIIDLTQQWPNQLKNVTSG